MNESITARLADWCADAGSTLKSVVKLALQAKRTEIAADKPDGPGKPLYILGNGPALKRNLDEDLQLLCESDTMAVNFAANSGEFSLLRPRYYVLADPHFFNGFSDPNVCRLWENLKNVDWNMTLLIPAKAKLRVDLLAGSNVEVQRFNFLAMEGFPWFERLAFGKQWGMPRPRNVLIPSIMTGIWLGYRQIYLLGADHSWLQSIWVDDENHVVTVQPHFYADNKQEKQRVSAEYTRHHLHDVLNSFRIAFKSYHHIARYASAAGVEIINATPGSYIDAFVRGNISTSPTS